MTLVFTHAVGQDPDNLPNVTLVSQSGVAADPDKLLGYEYEILYTLGPTNALSRDG